MTSPLKEILSGAFLSFIAKKIGNRWRLFFTRLKLEPHLFDHWETDHIPCSDEPIIVGLTEWKKIPLANKLLSYRDIEEIKDWLVLVLKSECGRKDISDDIQKYLKDLPIHCMDEIIDMLTTKVTKDRPSLFGALEIDWQSIEADLPTCAPLKSRTGACLNTWFTDQHLKYWKYQELLMTFRDSELDSEADSIIERFMIKELNDVRQYFKAEEEEVKFLNCSESLTSGNNADSHITIKALFVGNSEPSQNISLTVNLSLPQERQHLAGKATPKTSQNISLTVNLSLSQERQHLACKASPSATIDRQVDIPKGVPIAQVLKRNYGDKNEQIVFQPSLADKELSRKSEEEIYLRNKRPIEETIVENDACKKKLRTSYTENITGACHTEMEEHARQRLKTNSNSEKKGKFYIICKLCGKFIVDGQYIRRIKKAYSIICDKEIFGKIDGRQTKKSQTFDDVRKTDKIFGLSCGHNWGSILIYQNCKFVSLSQDYMTIVNKETSEPLRFKKWSEVHMEFPLDDITDNELIEYRSKQ